MAKKRKNKKSNVVPFTSKKLSPKNYIIKVARKLEVLEVLMMSGIHEIGSGHVIVARQKNNGEIIVAVYLVDIWCCGVKDTFFSMMDQAGYDYFKGEYENTEEEGKLVEVTPNYGFNLIYGAVEYAEDLGIEQYKDFSITEFMLDDVEEITYEDIDFGKDGKPYYCEFEMDRGPNRILKILEKSVGLDNFESELLADQYEEFDDESVEDAEAHIEMILDYLEGDADAFSFYNLYNSIVYETLNLYEFEEKNLRKRYKENPLGIVDELVPLFHKKGEEEEDSINESDDHEFYALLESVVEIVAIYGSGSFLENEFFIKSFKEIEKINDKRALLWKSILTSSDEGRLRILITLYDEDFDLEEMYNDIKAYIPEEASNLDSVESIVLHYFFKWQELNGTLTKNRLNEML